MDEDDEADAHPWGLADANPYDGSAASQLMADLESVLPPPRVGKRPRPRPFRANSPLEPLGQVVSDVAEERGWQSRLSLHTLRARWAELAGDVNAAHSSPERFDKTVVTVRADSTTWASALRLIAPQLVARLNQALGDGSVTRVDVLGPTGPTWKHGPKSVRDGRGPRDTYG